MVSVSRSSCAKVQERVCRHEPSAHLVQAETPAASVYAAGFSNAISLGVISVPAKINVTTAPSSEILVNQSVNVVIMVPVLDNLSPTGSVTLYQGSTMVKKFHADQWNSDDSHNLYYGGFGDSHRHVRRGRQPGGFFHTPHGERIVVSIRTGGAVASTSTLTASPATPPRGPPITLTASVASTAAVAAASGQVQF
jgi:hypothetical protein